MTTIIFQGTSHSTTLRWNLPLQLLESGLAGNCFDKQKREVICMTSKARLEDVLQLLLGLF